jgi:hypothetical protein
MSEEPLPRLSVIVPVGPGDANSRALLPGLAPLADCAEVILAVARAGDAEDVHETHPGAHRIVAPEGRAQQQNAGARAARGEWLWFLHADSVLGADAVPALRRALERHEQEDCPDALYYFELRFLPDGPRLTALNAIGAWLRCRLFRMPFGDQGLMLRAATFKRLGGFDESLALGEDLALVLAAQQADVAIRPIGAVLRTSARRYRERGWARNTWRNLRLTWQLSRAFFRRGRSASA